ncbi:MAG: NAD-dependent protein deacylase [Anaerovoracaceae bacterium]|nr:NAD-dependent protein deacylase [Anaerovoracaceae bacterium]
MYEELKKIIDESNNIVFFGGAGVSTESGVPDFRSENGLWNAKTRFNCTPEEIVSHSFFINRTDDFYEYYMQNLIFPDVKPNATHYALAKLEQMGKLKAIVTQNIDGLHQAAGSKEVYEIHGTISRAHCMECGKEYDLDYTLDKSHWKEGTYTPLCSCGGVLKPDVVLYEEALNDELIMKSVKAISEADTLIIGGTSLVVYPAASFVNYFKGKHLILINKQETSYDKNADMVIHDSLGKVFSSVVDGIEYTEKPVELNK